MPLEAIFPSVHTHGLSRPPTVKMQQRKAVRALPGVLRAAGLMVPDPSIIPPPTPFIEVVTTGCVAEYIATTSPRRYWTPLSSPLRSDDDDDDDDAHEDPWLTWDRTMTGGAAQAGMNEVGAGGSAKLLHAARPGRESKLGEVPRPR